MTTVNLSPVFNVPFIQDADGNPLNGGKIFAYEAGSNSVLLDTFTTSAGDVANRNPIVLDSSGNLPAEIWLTEGQAYNLVLTNSSGTTVLKGFDNVTGVTVPATTGGGVANPIWVITGGVAYLTPTQFLVTGNKTAEYAVGNRVRITLSGGFTYGVVTAVSFSSPNTLVTIVNDGTVLNSSISVAEYSLLSASPGETVDAGGVSFFDVMTYATNTVGWKINANYSTLAAADAVLNTRVSTTYNVQGTSGTNNYTASTDPLITTYTTGQKFVLVFRSASSGACTVNINGIGVKNLYQYTSSGAKTTAVITAGMASQIAYDGVDFILLDQLPTAAGATPRGSQVFTSNGVFTVPSGVTTIKVSVNGGGGGGGEGGVTGDVETGYTNTYGGTGGTGGNAVKYLTVSPGGTYSVTIGAGGAGSGSGNGSAGGSTTFGASLVVATGGGGGFWNPTGAGSNGSNGTLSVGSWGTFALGMYSSGIRAVGGTGGAGTSGVGANGYAGLCIVEW